jgi:lysophospholipase L1-like esterase
MKTHLLLGTVFIAGTSFAQNASTVWPMPSPFPSAPHGTNSAAFASPRLDWLERVQVTDARAQKIAGSIELIFDGDSSTDGWQGRGKEIWTERYGKLNAFDFGIPGDRTQHVLWRLDAGQVNAMHPKLIALMIGTNNLGGNTVQEIAGGVQAIVADYQKRCPDAAILLQAIFPRGQNATDPNRAKIKAVNEILSKLGDDKKVIYTDFGDKFLSPDGSISPEVMPDFIHPSAKGYQIWADAIQPIISKYFPAK